ncbi:hypothetical protein M3Y98_00913900 [Aphelenchoides besseyi]|nr:hypothetical protein M3Y98_00913900 [Aphelenchoides besseyi]KAI6193494.1 hypothetical protein M3Y96_01023600 [Aphelenchoides besseyi]
MFFSSIFFQQNSSSTSKKLEFDESLRNKHNLTQADLLKEKYRREQVVRDPKEYWHEETFHGQKQRWNYRSELVGRLGLNRDHRLIWLAFGGIILVGFSSFVVVKARVIENRREQMMERERMRRLLESKSSKDAGIV